MLKGTEEKKGDTPVSKEQELLFDVMQDLRELNHMSSKQDYKVIVTCFLQSHFNVSFAYILI